MVISFAESALVDLEEVQAWYMEQGVPDVGARLVEEVFQRVQALADHPDMDQVVPEFDQPFLRELIHPPFRIVYRRDPKRVRVVRVCCSFLRLTRRQRQRHENLVARSERWLIDVACFNSNFDNGIFHGIDTYDHRKTRAVTGFSRLIYNRVGVNWI